MSTDSPPLSVSAPTWGWRLKGLPAREIRRRLVHILPGLLPFALWPAPHKDPISPTLWGIVVAVFCALVAGIFLRYRRIARTGESASTPAACILGYAGTVLALLICFPAQAELGLTALAILAFGDGMATLGGLTIGGRALPWNPQKTWSGLICFLLASIPLASIVYWGETHNLEAQTPGVSLLTALLVGGGASLTCAIAESVNSRWNDNLRVGLTAAVMLIVLQSAFVGW